MKTKEPLKKILNETVLQEYYIPTGLTNTNYEVVTERNHYFVRIPKPENAGLFDYHHEAHILSMISNHDIDVPLIYYDPITGFKISKAIEHASTFDIRYAQQASKLLKKLHSLKLVSGKRFDIRSVYKTYLDKTQNISYDLQPYQHYIQDCFNLSDTWILCHNDCVEGNFLFTDQKSYLIDFEYAKDNDPYFDIMSLITENDIIDEKVRNDIYSSYFDSPLTLSQKNKLFVFEQALHVLWCQWAQMMVSIHGDPLYQEIADLKWRRLQENEDKK